VRDDEDASAGMPLRDPSERAEDPFLMHLRRLADELDPIALDGRQPLPRAPVLLAQVGIEDDGNSRRSATISAVSRARARSLE